MFPIARAAQPMPIDNNPTPIYFRANNSIYVKNLVEQKQAETSSSYLNNQ